MAQYVQNGDRIDYRNTGEVPIKQGDPVPLPARVGVALTDIPPGEAGVIGLVGAFCFPAAAEAIPIGTAVYWDAANSVVTKTKTGNLPAGLAITDKADTAAGDLVVRLE